MEHFDLMKSLGLYGYDHINSVMLATLAMKAPTLFVGTHGTGKTMIAESLARLLDWSVRLIHVPTTGIDDLIGIVVPVKSGADTHLEMFSISETDIWDAKIILLDELNRAAPVTIGKYFDMVNKRTLMGKPLTNLQFIFATINPPKSFDGNDDITMGNFFGVFPLDSAMTDRFNFIIHVPDFSQMTFDEQIQIVNASLDSSSNPDDLITAIHTCETLTPDVDDTFGDVIAMYVIYFAKLMLSAGVHLSGRRVNMLRRMIPYVHAANIALTGNHDYPLEQSVQETVANGIPQLAEEEPPVSQIMAAHKQAFEVASLRLDSPEVCDLIIKVPDPIERLTVASQMDLRDELYSILITRALSSELPTGKREALAVALFVTHHQHRNLTSQAYEVLANVTMPLFYPIQVTFKEQQAGLVKVIDDYISKNYAESPHRLLLRNFGLHYMELWREANVRTTLNALAKYIEKFQQVDA